MTEKIKHLTIKITGRVQGVFFRAYAKEVADNLSVRGFVKNMPDGSIYIEAEGVEEYLKKFFKWCHHGPVNAKVEAIEAETARLKHYDSFNIL